MKRNDANPYLRSCEKRTAKQTPEVRPIRETTNNRAPPEFEKPFSNGQACISRVFVSALQTGLLSGTNAGGRAVVRVPRPYFQTCYEEGISIVTT